MQFIGDFLKYIFKLIERAIVPVLTSGKEEKTFLVLVHSFFLSDEANSGFTLSITPLRWSLSNSHVTTKMSVLEPILFICFEGMKTTPPSRENIPQQIPCSLQEEQTFRKPQGGVGGCKSWVCPFLQQNWV